MQTDAPSLSSTTAAPETATRRRVALLAVVLAVTAVIAIPAGVLWPEPAGGGETYAYADIAPHRDLWWGLLSMLSVLLVVNVPTQAIAAALLVRRRGATWVTAGAVLMWLGAAMQASGVAAWASAYFYPTDPSVDAETGRLLMEQVNHDTTHLFAVMLPGALLVLIGTVLQAVGLFRSHTVPTWVPITSLAVVATFVVPGNGWLGVITSVPMAAAAMGLGYHAWRQAG